MRIFTILFILTCLIGTIHAQGPEGLLSAKAECIITEKEVQTTDSTWFDYDQFKNKVSEIVFKWDERNHVLRNSIKYTYSYQKGSSGKITSYTASRWYNNEWVNSGKTDYEYDAKGNKIRVTKMIWEDGAWLNDEENLYSYNPKGKMISDQWRTWYKFGSSWSDQWKTIFEYDQKGNLIKNAKEVWTGSEWKKDNQHSYTYNKSGKLTNTLEQFWSDGKVLVNTYNTIDEYDNQGNKIKHVFQEWIDKQWITKGQTIYKYDEKNNLITETEQSWDDSKKIFVTKIEHNYKYDEKKNRLEDHYKGWNDDQNEYNFYKSIFSYDSSNNQVSELMQLMDSKTKLFISYSLIRKYYMK